MEKIRVICPACQNVNAIPKKDSYNKANCGHCKASLLEENLINLNQSNFDAVLVNSDIPVVVDFWAPWCGPCQMMGPVFERVSKNFALKALFTKVDTQAEQNLGAKYNIRSIPTLVIYKNGVEIHRVSGATDESQLTYLINSLL